MNKKNKGSKAGKGDDLLVQMGMIPGMGNDDDDDEDLEAELLALQGMSAPQKQKRSTKKSGNNDGVDLAAIDKMAHEAMNMDGDDDDDVEDDDELLAELQQLSSDEDSKPAPKPSSQPSPSKVAPPAPAPRMTSLPSQAHQMAAPAPAERAPSPRSSTGKQGILAELEERLEMYNGAYSHAQTEGNSSKARRMNRGAKTLKDLIRQAKAGKPVPEEEIPPVVHAGQVGKQKEDSPAATPMETVPSEPVRVYTQPDPPVSPSQGAAAPLSPDVQKSIAVMTERREQYKLAALQAKKSGDIEHARSYFKTAKQFDSVIDAATAGNPIDLSKMPPSPPSASAPSIQVEKSRNQGHGEAAAAAEPELDVPMDSSVDKDLFGAPDAPQSVMEALQQRLQKYKSTVEKAKEEGNSGKARRMGRIAKQYEDAIKAHKAGRPVDYSELPTPPGFAPIPTGSSPAQSMSPPAASPQQRSPGAPQMRTAAGSGGQTSPATASPPKPAVKRKSGEIPVGRQQQQLAFILDRQKQFKLAALKAKQAGDKEQAMAYLKQAKGFDPMIESLHNGVRVDMSKIPRPPGMEEESLSSYEFVESDDCSNSGQTGDREEMFKKLEQDLINQIRTYSSNSNHFTHTGDISSADRFDKLGQNCRKDLDALKNAYKHGDPVPRFHYETKEFKLFKCCTDLGDSDLELIVVRGIHYNPPSGYTPEQLDTYVKYEFPFPTDDCPKGQTQMVKSTACPEYEKSFKIPINRKSRSFQRLIKMKVFKFEVYYRRGILKSDKVLGSASVKLQPLEDHCEIHECVDLMDGRRPCGGRLEVRVRIRQPLVSKEEEEVKEKWLVIDLFNRALTAGSPAANSGATSIDVLKFEKQLLDKKIITYQKQLTPTQITALQHKSQQLQDQALKLQQDLKQGGIGAYKSYAACIEKSSEQYVQEARALLAKGDKDKAQIAMSKKKLVEKEVAAIRSKIPA
ncbi:coiled-coil and C2 domain-containing protein 1-like isoform X2 [Lineus longissimus]|uniref:coiled-coil and C2 domain-containing protein 1-like isoform X2 n=1 Tax=Lineus longissimus TaxID=88925 RepID=UPI00315CF3D5